MTTTTTTNTTNTTTAFDNLCNIACNCYGVTFHTFKPRTPGQYTGRRNDIVPKWSLDATSQDEVFDLLRHAKDAAHANNRVLLVCAKFNKRRAAYRINAVERSRDFSIRKVTANHVAKYGESLLIIR